MTMMTRWAGAVVVGAAVTLVAACGGDGGAETSAGGTTTVERSVASTTSPASASAPVTTTPTAAVGECREFVPFFSDDRGAAAGQRDAVQAVAQAVPLPAGVTLVTGRVSTDSDEPGGFAVAIDLCGGDIGTADQLRPLATEFARAYKASAVGDAMFSLYVGHYASYPVTGKAVSTAKLRDDDFALHLWNGNPSVKAELATWEVVGR
ncbi:hypothetical protein [Prescottella subtropica]|uniref:hypothetical protein n=1 Tax=Prescottella subtropica TaxID=2545757 RepID=UPI0010F5C19F|nr:hypothetical protein [Prescottella subtropica]